MPKKITIAIDAMGGDNAPDKTIEGISFFLKKNNREEFLIQIFGDEKLIKEKIKKFDVSEDKINIIHTDLVSDKETPLTAIKNSKNTSMWRSINAQMRRPRYDLSTGNTGILLVISRMILKMMNNVRKPALRFVAK